MIVRPLASNEILDCVNIYRKLWREEIARRSFVEMSLSFRVPETQISYYVAFLSGRIVGCAGMQESHILQGVFDFIFVGVDPEFQGKQVGRALTEHRISEVERRGGCAIHTITGKPKFFRKFGFRKAYSSGELTMMHKQLRTLEL